MMMRRIEELREEEAKGVWRVDVAGWWCFSKAVSSKRELEELIDSVLENWCEAHLEYYIDPEERKIVFYTTVPEYA